MATKRVYRPGVTGIGTFVYPKLSSPDTKGKFADGKYKTEFVFSDKKAGEAFVKELAAAAKELVGSDAVSGLPVKKNKAGKLVKDDDGNYVFRFKSTKKPVIVDAKRKRLPEGVFILGGSKGRISYTLTNYDEGISLWLDAVQIIDLVKGSPGERAFDEVDGFDADTLDPEDFSTEDTDETSDQEETDDEEEKFSL